MEGVQGVEQHQEAMGRDVDLSTLRRRKEEMEEAQDAEQNHEEMGRDVDLSTLRRRKEEMEEAQDVKHNHEARAVDLSTPRRRKEEMEEAHGEEQSHEVIVRDVESSTPCRRKEEMEAQDVEQIHEAMGRDIELSTSNRRKEETEEGQGEEDNQEMNSRDVELKPELWENLPSDLIDLIIDKVLIGLPFSQVFRFCCVCKRWRDFLLSMEYLLCFHNLDEFMIFNPRTGVWDSMSLLLSPEDARRLEHMDLVSCEGGLLYFANALMNELIICNPLTRRCSPTKKEPDATRQIWSAGRTTRRSFPSEWRLVWYASLGDVRDSLVGRKQEIIINNVTSSDAGYGYIHLQKQYEAGTPTVSLNVCDSVRRRWVRVPDVYSDFHFVIFPFLWKASARGSLMLGFSTKPGKPGGPFTVLFYDIATGRYHWFWNASSLQNESRPTRKKPLFATVSSGGELEFLEFLDGGLTLTGATFPPPREVLRKLVRNRVLPDLTTIRDFAEILSFLYVEQGDNLYYICLFRQAQGHLNISVRTNNLVNGVERVSNWMECRPPAWTRLDFPTARNFHIFTPSFLSP